MLSLLNLCAYSRNNFILHILLTWLFITIIAIKVEVAVAYKIVSRIVGVLLRDSSYTYAKFHVLYLCLAWSIFFFRALLCFLALYAICIHNRGSSNYSSVKIFHIWYIFCAHSGNKIYQSNEWPCIANISLYSSWSSTWFKIFCIEQILNDAMVWS